MNTTVTIRRRSNPIPESRFDVGMKGGLVAGGNVIRNEVRRELRGGYQSSLGNKGDFVTGASLTHCTLGEPVVEANRSFIRVGSDLLYNLFWEVGHHNTFTRHYERDEKWVPAFRRAVPRAVEAFRRVFQRSVFV